MRDIFKKTKLLPPYEYPELLEYKDAIRSSYWVHTQYNFTSDIQNYFVDVSDKERDIIKKTILAISTIEVKVKEFWGKLYERLPKLEISLVGSTFNESEVRHFEAYKFLLDKLGLNDEFNKIANVPAIMGREKYLEKYLSGARAKDDRIFTKTILLFSLFIEHVSLFSQFLIMLSFNKERNLFKGISNVVEATSLEEEVHGLFGQHLIRIIKEEHPDWFDDTMEDIVIGACQKAYVAEIEILNWIFEKGELDFLSKDTIDNFIKDRFNNSLKSIGYTPIFHVNYDLLEDVEWFDLQLKSTKEDDFFYKHSVAYNKKSVSITEEDLF